MWANRVPADRVHKEGLHSTAPYCMHSVIKSVQERNCNRPVNNAPSSKRQEPTADGDMKQRRQKMCKVPDAYHANSIEVNENIVITDKESRPRKLDVQMDVHEDGVERSATSRNLSEIRNVINLQRQSIAAEKRQTKRKKNKIEIQGADKGGTEWNQMRREKNKKIRGNPCSNDKMDARQPHSPPIHDSSERNNAGNKEPSSKVVKTNYDYEMRDTRKDAHSSPSHDRETRSNTLGRNRQKKEIQPIQNVEERLCAVQVA